MSKSVKQMQSAALAARREARRLADTAVTEGDLDVALAAEAEADRLLDAALVAADAESK